MSNSLYHIFSVPYIKLKIPYMNYSLICLTSFNIYFLYQIFPISFITHSLFIKSTESTLTFVLQAHPSLSVKLVAKEVSKTFRLFARCSPRQGASSQAKPPSSSLSLPFSKLLQQVEPFFHLPRSFKLVVPPRLRVVDHQRERHSLCMLALSLLPQA